MLIETFLAEHLEVLTAQDGDYEERVQKIVESHTEHLIQMTKKFGEKTVNAFEKKFEKAADKVHNARMKLLDKKYQEDKAAKESKVAAFGSERKTQDANFLHKLHLKKTPAKAIKEIERELAKQTEEDIREFSVNTDREHQRQYQTRRDEIPSEKTMVSEFKKLLQKTVEKHTQTLERLDSTLQKNDCRFLIVGDILDRVFRESLKEILEEDRIEKHYYQLLSDREDLRSLNLSAHLVEQHDVWIEVHNSLILDYNALLSVTDSPLKKDIAKILAVPKVEDSSDSEDEEDEEIEESDDE